MTGWTQVSAEQALQRLGDVRILAVDGRSGSGKSTLAQRFAETIDGAVVVHTDDVAWYESFFGWDDLLVQGVLAPWRAGSQVRFRPPAWDRRGRIGAIEVPATAPLLVVEGVGSSRRSLAPFLDAAVWVETDQALSRTRGVARDGGTSEAAAFWDEWQEQEVPFLASDAPWQRADLVFDGTCVAGHGPLMVRAARR